MIESNFNYMLKNFPVSDVLNWRRDLGEVKYLMGSKDYKDYEAEIKEGRSIYIVRLKLDSDLNLKNTYCTCKDYKRNKSCWHILKTVELASKTMEQSGLFYSKQMIEDLNEAYSKKINFLTKEQIFLKIKVNYDKHPYMEFKVGKDKFYVIKNLSDFLFAKEYGEELEFGKGFTYNPSIQYFSYDEEKLLSFLSSIQSSHMMSGVNKKYFNINDSSGKIIFNILKTLEFDFEVKHLDIFHKNITILEENPNIDLFLYKDGDGYLFRKSKDVFIPLTHDLSFIYYRGNVYQPSEIYKKTLTPLSKIFLGGKSDKIQIDADNIDFFTNNVLTKINRVQKINISDDLREEFIIQPLRAEFKLDRKDDELVGKLFFYYGDLSINPFSNKINNSQEILIRDTEKEEAILKYLEETPFRVREGEFYIDNEKDIYEFFLKSDELLNYEGIEVFYSEDLKRSIERTSRPIDSYFRYNYDIDMFEFSIDIPDVSEEELNQIFLSLKRKKKYYRLNSGDFISLDRGVFSDLNELEETGDLDFSNLKDGKLTFPLYRAIYLDRFMREREHINIKESAKIKELIDEIRSGTEKEFIVPENFKSVLRDYQVKGYRFLRTLHRYGFGGVLADEMGLGKTIQMIAFFQAMKEEGYGESLLIVPTSLVSNWVSEFKKFAPKLNILVIKGTADERKALIENSTNFDIVLTSYPLMRNDFQKYMDKSFETCVLDEGQYIKNHLSLNAKSVKTIKAKSRFVLTGTPMENTLLELHSIFDFLMPGYLLSHLKFQKTYERPIVKGDERALKTLKEHINVFMLRRLKQEVLLELPDKIEQEIKVDLTLEQKKIYLAHLQTIRADVKQKLEEKGYDRSRFEILSLLTRLRQICQDPSIFIEDYQGGSGKLERLMDLIEELKESNRRALVFSSFTSVLHRIEERLIKAKISYQYLDGQTPQDDRGERVRAFNEGEGVVFLISLRAGGTGLNLASADTVIHFDPWWNPKVEDQATDRAHRIGQKNNVLVIRMLADGTIEEKIYELQSKKRSLIDKVIEDGETLILKLTEAEILKLFD